MSTALFGQETFRENPPEPGPAPEIQLADYESFMMDNGMRVIVVTNNKLPRVSYQLSLNVPLHMEGDEAGLSSMAGQMLRNGTTNRTKAQLDKEIDFIGASLSSSGQGLFGSSLTKHEDKLLELMTDVLYNPSFPEDEFDKLQTQTKSGITASKDSPDFIASNVSRVMVYGQDHPYGEVESEETIENITAEKCRAYYTTYFKPNIATLVVVGDVSMAKVKRNVKKYFGDWEPEEMEEPSFPKPQPPASTQVDFVDKKGAVQSVVNITYPVYLKPGDDDFIAANVMNSILGGGSNGRLFKNIREDKGYTYGAYASLSTDEEVGRFNASASVRNEVTDSALVEFMYEFARLRTKPVSERELMLARNNLAGSFARSLESPQTIARFAINTYRYDLPEDYYANYLKRLSAVSTYEVMEVAKKYIKPDQAHIVVVGSKSEVAEKMEQFGEVKFFDMFGNPAKTKTAGADVTAQQVIDNYLSAIGGKDKLMQVEDLTVRMSTTVQGMSMEVTNQQVADGKLAVDVKMNGNSMQNIVYDGEKAKVSQMGNSQVVEGEQADAYKAQAKMFPEMYYADMGAEMNLEGIEAVDGADAYVVNIIMPGGQNKTEYYGVESGLKLKEVATQTVQGQTITQTSVFGDYQKVDGILFPFSMESSGAMPFPVNFKTEEIKVNTGIPDTTFVIEE